MKTTWNFLGMAFLALAMLCAAGCTKPDDNNSNNNGGDNNGPEGAIKGLFSVSADKQVYFSRGNLQYQASTNTWRFAENQWDYVGGGNSNISSDYSGWIDLFGWGTSGYNGHSPYSTSESDSFYNTGNSIYGTNYDWGVYNSIVNGGNMPNKWRTLARNEWVYLLSTRNTNTGSRYAKAVVDGVNGLIILPDDWSNDYYNLKETDNGGAAFSTNVIDSSLWMSTFEANGAVFLPVTGIRFGTMVRNVEDYGAYWSSTCNNNSTFLMYVANTSVNPEDGGGFSGGISVRLVQDSGGGGISAGNVKVTTCNPTNITINEATCRVEVTPDDINYLSEIGICWSTSIDPTINDNHKSSETVDVSFTCTISILEPGTLYHVRAYALYDSKYYYGEDKTFRTHDAPEGAINGLFSISANKQVLFSKGNLQYQASTNTWRFAENQWDFVGGTHYESGEQYGNVYENGVRCDNVLVSSDYDGWIDLFGWGTSGYNHGAICYQPWSTSKEQTDYYAYGSATCGLNDQTGKADWGYNAIVNGGNQEHSGWRTLTIDEYAYLLVMRNTVSGIRYAKAIVNEVPGLVLLPDNWSSQNYDLNHTNDYGAGYDGNVISLSDWTSKLEANGAVFFSITGMRWLKDNVVVFSEVEENWMVGIYWTASTTNTFTYDMVFYDRGLWPHDEVGFDGESRYNGLGVRLVKDYQENTNQ